MTDKIQQARRELFEAWTKSEHGDLTIRQDGEYFDDLTHGAWLGFNAAPVSEAKAQGVVMQATDGGRNPRYEGLFDGETEEHRAFRLNSSPVSAGGVDEREAFEAWRLEKFCGGIERLKKCSNAQDVYYYTAEQEAWKVWQARAALSAGKDSAS